jgi:hypothetical protein
MDDNHIVGRMIAVLHKHPNEWLTFRRLSLLIEIPGCDADIIAAMAEYRPDLFALSDDRRLKLRTGVIENVARLGISNWQVPPRPELARPERFRDATAIEPRRGGCYCTVQNEEVLRHLIAGSLPDEALVYSCCWRHICRVRGLFFTRVSAETWREICQRRGYLRERENPRGF